MTNEQLIKGSIVPETYNRYIDAGTAFNKGLMMATQNGAQATSNPVGAVRNNYERQLEGYLNKLPAGTDLAAVPEKYRGQIQSFLIDQKRKYVELARDMDEYEVGSEEYMARQQGMNDIRNSFTNLDAQFRTYGQNKEKIIEDIQSNQTSLYGENQMNVNLLRSVYNEELDLHIGETGKISFIGDDGAVEYDNLPGYELKSYKAAGSILRMTDEAYNKGDNMQVGDANYTRYKDAINLGLNEGGKNTLLSLIHDGLIGGKKLIDDPLVAKNVEAYYNNELSEEGLREVVVDQYMGIISSMSAQGYEAKQVKAAQRQASKSGSRSGYKSTKGKYKSPEVFFSKKHGQKIMYYAPYNPNDKPLIKDLDGKEITSGPAPGIGVRNNTNKTQDFTPYSGQGSGTSGNSSRPLKKARAVELMAKYKGYEDIKDRVEAQLKKEGY